MVPKDLLAQYLADKDLKRDAFAAKCGIDPTMISHYTRGSRRPGLANALRIQQATGGKIPAEAWTKVPPARRAVRRTRKAS